MHSSPESQSAPAKELVLLTLQATKGIADGHEAYVACGICPTLTRASIHESQVSPRGLEFCVWCIAGFAVGSGQLGMSRHTGPPRMAASCPPRSWGTDIWAEPSFLATSISIAQGPRGSSPFSPC